jgi:tRNA-2-methylthio-N6-dimethylallyladenosine synthase
MRLQAKIEAQALKAIRKKWSARSSASWSKALPRKDAAELAGRTDNNRIVNFAGSPRLVGRFVEVAIRAALPHSLRGEIVTRES